MRVSPTSNVIDSTFIFHPQRPCHNRADAAQMASEVKVCPLDLNPAKRGRGRCPSPIRGTCQFGPLRPYGVFERGVSSPTSFTSSTTSLCSPASIGLVTSCSSPTGLASISILSR